MSVIKSVYSDQEDVLRSILTLTGLECFDADITYGNGMFYKGDIPKPQHKFDINPQTVDTVEASSTDLPLAAATLGSVVFDPPFLTYIKEAREHNSVMAKRFGGYWTYGELEKHYTDTFKEVSRVLKKNGILVVKCQDIIHNHSLHPTHMNCVTWAAEFGLKLKDLFILPVKHRMPMPNRAAKQKHARIFHSYFLVFIKKD